MSQATLSHQGPTTAEEGRPAPNPPSALRLQPHSPDPVATPETGQAWHLKPCSGPLMGSVTSMALAATPGPVSLAATLNLLLLPQDKRAIPISQDFNKDDMGLRAWASARLRGLCPSLGACGLQAFRAEPLPP